MFNSLVHIVVLLYQTSSYEKMVHQYKYLLTFIPKVTRNEGAEAIDTILNTVSSSQDFKLLEQIYSITSTTLQGMSDTEVKTIKMNIDGICERYYFYVHPLPVFFFLSFFFFLSVCYLM
jgi:hypothetical protein